MKVPAGSLLGRPSLMLTIIRGELKMLLTRFVPPVGALALMLSAGGISVGLAADVQPVLPSDAAPAVVSSFTLPSDLLPASAVPYMFRTDPTGQLVDNSTSTPKETTDNLFLTYSIRSPGIRLDTPVTACQYYLVIKAVTGCGPNGELQGAVTFDQWKQAVKIDKYGPSGQTNIGHFINQVDLNLTRDHHMISYGPTQLAGYVCNHSGSAPTAADPSGLFPPQDEVDALIKDIKQNKHLIACVAMEFSSRDTPPGTKPFTKFWIFGANGDLLSTVDLDGRGPKGVPNVCTACHGGKFDYENASGQFDKTVNTGRPAGDLGAHFLPFDMANFAFSSKLSQANREEAIFKLNLDVFTTENSLWFVDPSGFINANTLGSASIAQLINQWYDFNVTPSNAAPQFNSNFSLAPTWDFDTNHQQAYKNAISHSCRTCHVAMDNAAFELNSGLVTSALVCSHVMPNSKVTFDRFWLSQRTDVPGQPPQPAGGQPNYLSFVAPPVCNYP
jgi:hypothetical protein